MNNSRELASIISLLLLMLCRRSSTALLCQCFIQRRIRRRRLRLRFINAIAHSIYYLTAQRNNRACARAPRSVWVLPRSQIWFQQLLNDHALDHWWKENFSNKGSFRVHMPACWTSTSSSRYAYERCHPCREDSGSKFMEIGKR